MDTQYNILKLEELLNSILKKHMEDPEKVRRIIRDLMNEKDSSYLEESDHLLLQKYAKESIHLVLERKILLSLENHSLDHKLSYWNSLKERGPKTRTHLLSHFYDAYLEDLKANTFKYHDYKTIHEIEADYETKTKESFEVFEEDMKRVIDGVSSITLNHMQNLNANGRTISLQDREGKTVRKGGIFLSKQSKIGYAKFVSKETLLKNVYQKGKVISLKSGTITVYDFERIVNSLTQTIKIAKSEQTKSGDTRIIQDGDKKVGSIFLGKSGIDLENGTYISMDELSKAINQYLEEKQPEQTLVVEEKPKKLIQKTGKLAPKIAAAAALLTTTVLTATSSAQKLKQEIPSKKVEKVDYEHYFSSNEELSMYQTTALKKEEPKQTIMQYVKEESPIIEEPVVSSEEFHAQEEVENTIVEETPTIEELQEHQMNKEDILALADTAIEEANEDLPILEEVEQVPEEEAVLPISQQEEITEEKEETTELKEETLEEQTLEDFKEPAPVEEKKEEIPTEEKAVEEITVSEEQPATIEEMIEEEQTIEEQKEEVESLEEISEEKEPPTGEEVVNYALGFVGNPYVYGGTSLTSGTDCSGFTMGVFDHFGITLPRSSDAQRKVGEDIGSDLENALPGDLLCYDGHVGIYIGDGQMVHASTAKSGIKVGPTDYKVLRSIRRLTSDTKELEGGKQK